MNCFKILIVDDDPTMTELLGEILQSHNASYIIKEYQFCLEALSIIREYSPDLLIIGYNNADVNGDVFVKTIKKEPALRQVKILGISGNCPPEIVEKWTQIGIDTFIKKPFSVEQLLRETEKLLRD